jgi:FAD/FMN-containing dehydrogenase
VGALPPAIDSHEERVAAVRRQLLARPAGSRVTIRKPQPGHSIRDPSYKRGLYPVDVDGLRHILSIDTEKCLATVEGQVTMGELCRATLAHGLLPRVVPEFRSFTVAGLINGEGLQSSSHRFGVFTHNLAAVELLLGNGEVVTASAAGHAELFDSIASSLGTLGIVTAAVIKLMPAQPYVRSSYRHFRRLDEYLAALEQAVERSTFLEGLVFGPHAYTIVESDLVPDPAGLPVFRPDAEGAPYYYQHVRRARRPDVLDTLSYLHRSERGMWWAVEHAVGFPLLTGTRWGRRLVDREVAGVFAAHGFRDRSLSVMERERCLVNQDMGVRRERLGEGIRWVQQNLGVYPIWNCPIKLPARDQERFGTTHLVDIGIYGEPSVSDYRHISAMRALQRFVDLPSIWGVCYLTRDELRAAGTIGFEAYDKLRARYGADCAFPHIFEKVIWVDPTGPDPGKIPFWRLYRTYGPRWYTKPGPLAVLAAAKTSQLAASMADRVRGV